MKDISRIIIFVLFVIITNPSFSQRDTVIFQLREIMGMEYYQYFLQKYLSYPPINRNLYIDTFYNMHPVIADYYDDPEHLIYTDNFISIETARWLNTDIETLSNNKFKPGTFTYADGRGTFIYDDLTFKLQLKKNKELLKEKKYLNSVSKFYAIKPERKWFNRDYRENDWIFILDCYFKNNIKNRIVFIKRYYKLINNQIFVLLKLDLDMLLNIQTPNFIKENGKINKKKLKIAISIWENKINNSSSD